MSVCSGLGMKCAIALISKWEGYVEIKSNLNGEMNISDISIVNKNLFEF